MRSLTISMLVLVASLAAQDSRPVTDSGRIASSISMLDSEFYDARTSAMDQLRAAGESARPQLEKASKDLALSLEARGRADALLKDLDAKKSGIRTTPISPVSPEAPEGVVPEIQDNSITSSSTSMFMGPDGTVEVKKDKSGIRVTVKPRDGGMTVYQADDNETFKKQHPEVYEKYKSMGLDGSNNRLGPIVRKHGGIPLPESRFGVWRNHLGEIKIPDMPPVDGAEIERVIRERLNGTERGGELWGRGPQAEGVTGRQLGVVVEKVPNLVSRHLKLAGVGVVVVEVVPNSIAQKLGVQDDDIIKSVDGVVIYDVDGIRKAMNPKTTDKPSGANPALEIIRNGDVIKL